MKKEHLGRQWSGRSVFRLCTIGLTGIFLAIVWMMVLAVESDSGSGLVDLPQMLLVFVLTVLYSLCFKEKARYAGIFAGVLSMLIYFSWFCLSYRTVKLLFFRISAISLFWGVVCSAVILLLQMREKSRKEARETETDAPAEYGRAEERLERRDNQAHPMEGEHVSKNEMMDVFLKHTREVCETSRIAFYASVCCEIPKECHHDLIFLLEKALENAKKGCGGDRPQISVSIRREENFLLLDIRHRMDKTVCKGAFSSRRRKNRGPYSRSDVRDMEETAQRHDGSVQMTEEDGFFVCSILLDTRQETNRTKRAAG